MSGVCKTCDPTARKCHECFVKCTADNGHVCGECGRAGCPVKGQEADVKTAPPPAAKADPPAKKTEPEKVVEKKSPLDPRVYRFRPEPPTLDITSSAGEVVRAFIVMVFDRLRYVIATAKKTDDEDNSGNEMLQAMKEYSIRLGYEGLHLKTDQKYRCKTFSSDGPPKAPTDLPPITEADWDVAFEVAEWILNDSCWKQYAEIDPEDYGLYSEDDEARDIFAAMLDMLANAVTEVDLRAHKNLFGYGDYADERGWPDKDGDLEEYFDDQDDDGKDRGLRHYPPKSKAKKKNTKTATKGKKKSRTRAVASDGDDDSDEEYTDAVDDPDSDRDTDDDAPRKKAKKPKVKAKQALTKGKGKEKKKKTSGKSNSKSSKSSKKATADDGVVDLDP